MSGIVFWAEFPGIEQIVKASYTRTLGVTPGYIEVEMLPQSAITNIYGDFKFIFGNESLVLKDCKIDTASTTLDENGLVWSLKILDRRWRWSFGEIYGEYNIVGFGGDLIPAHERAPQVLAEYLFQAMGETNYDVSALPNDSDPHVEWDGNNPALELETLVHNLGCAVCITNDNTVKIVKLGSGASLPENGNISNDSLSINPSDAPDTIVVNGGNTLVQAWLRLRAVGLDFKGTIAPIDRLSYKPAGNTGNPNGGWAFESHLFPNVNETLEVGGVEISARKLATQTVWRWYQVDLVRTNAGKLKLLMNVPFGIGQILYGRQITPINDFLVDAEFDDTGNEFPAPCKVWGTFWKYNAGPPENVTQEYEGQFSVIGDKLVVQFDKQVLKWGGEDVGWQEADIYLLCSFFVRNYQTHAFHRYQYRLPTGQNNGTGPEVVNDDGLQLQVKMTSKPPFNSESQFKWAEVVGVKELDGDGKYLAQLALDKYQNDGTAERTYNGLIAIDTDGAIRQVRYSMDDNSGFETRASRNTESIPLIQIYNNKRERNQLKRLLSDGVKK